MTTNQLLDHLPAAEQRRVRKQSVLVLLRGGEQLGAQDLPAKTLLFPVQGFVSLVTPLDAHPLLQVGMVGNEGAVGAQLLLGVTASPVTALVLQHGEAWGMPADVLRRELPASPGLRRVLMRYLYVQWRQTITASACLHFHPLQARLARWLLMGWDRSRGNDFAATQEHLAHLLGVRRVGVTVAAGGLQAAGLIFYHRGLITVSDRTGLERAACPCYAQDLSSYRLGMKFAPEKAAH